MNKPTLNIQKSSLEMNHLFTRTIEMERSEIHDMFQALDFLQFGDEIYKDGPVILEVTPAHFFDEVRSYTFYVPINAEPVNLHKDYYTRKLKVPHALKVRLPFDLAVIAAIEEMKDFAKAQHLVHENKLFLVMTTTYTGFWTDIYLPYAVPKGGEM